MEETSKKVRHTPGPWKYELQQLSDGIDDNGVYINPRTIPDYFTIRAGEGFWRPDDNHKGFGITGYLSEDNARLLASAPSLLEALEALLPYLKAVGTNGNHWIPVVENAIKLAKGNGES